MEAGIETVSDAKSLANLEDSVHPTTMESMEMYCKRVHRKKQREDIFRTAHGHVRELPSHSGFADDSLLSG